MMTRAELLGAIMKHFEESVAISGTHGKTSTTSMISQVLLQENADPTISVGAIFKPIHSNVRVGHSKTFVTEACEYTDSFLSFYPKYSIILNIDAEHLDYFKNLENERKSFHKFAGNTSENGLLVVNGEIPNVKEITDGLHCKVVTYGFADREDYYPVDIEYDALGNPSFVPVAFGERLGRIHLHVPGHHNIGNALAAMAVLRAMGIFSASAARPSVSALQRSPARAAALSTRENSTMVLSLSMIMHTILPRLPLLFRQLCIILTRD